jgi:hypothetical protein
VSLPIPSTSIGSSTSFGTRPKQSVAAVDVAEEGSSGDIPLTLIHY